MFRLSYYKVHKEMAIELQALTSLSSQQSGYRLLGSSATKFTVIWLEVFRLSSYQVHKDLATNLQLLTLPTVRPKKGSLDRRMVKTQNHHISERSSRPANGQIF